MSKIVVEILKLGEKESHLELQKIITNTTTKQLIEAVKIQIKTPGGINFWNYLLRGFALCDSEEFQDKRFQCIEVFLKEINKSEFPYKQIYDLVTRLCNDLISFSNDHLINIIEYCEECIRAGDRKCVGWKDLLPETLLILTNQLSLSVNGIKMTGLEYRSSIIKSVCSMKWPIAILTPLANMFVDLKLTSDEITTILSKFAQDIMKLPPVELPALAYQLFSLCQTSSQVIMPIVAFEKFFHHFYYKKLFSDMDSNTTDFDSIDSFSDKELREAEETILHHLSFCTRFKINEHQMCVTLRNLSSSSEIILTPFMLSAILSMTQANREPDSWISSSPLLMFLKFVIKNNEDEKELSDYSVWCRDTLQTRYKDMDQIFSVLIDQNKDGKDVVTPGLVNLAFILLKAKNSPKLNNLGTLFLSKFIKKRFVFGHGVVKNLADWMIAEQDALQYSECLTILAIADTFTVSECIKTIKYVLDFFLWIPGKHAMRMMSFILPVIKISHVARDAFIEMLRKAINSKDLETCRLGVYGFCNLLKQLNNNNSQRTSVGAGAMLTQQSISGFSLMSQATLGNRSNPQRHFDMLTLEIIGCLRICFTAQIEIKETLYENLNRAVELNPKLTPHILEFIDHHFRKYFEVNEIEAVIHFDKIIKVPEETQNDIQILDNLGRLTMFSASATIVCDKHDLNYDTSIIKTIIKTVTERICSKDLKLMEMTGSLDHKKYHMALQQLNFLEGLMHYYIWTSKTSNDNVTKINELFKEHQRIRSRLKTLSSSSQNKKGAKKGKSNETVDNTTANNFTINGNIVKKSFAKPENIWDLPTLERFLRLLHDDVVSFAATSITGELRSNRDFVRYCLEVTAVFIENLRNQPEYKQVQHSRRILKHLCEVTRFIYERCIKNLPKLWSNFDATSAYLGAECIKQSLITAQKVYHKKFDKYLRDIDLMVTTQGKEKMVNIIQNVFDEAIKDSDELREETDGQKIPGILLECLEILYDFIDYEDPLSLESYNWLLKNCQTHEVHTKEVALILKLLFTQRVKTHSGTFFNTIAIHLENVIGKIEKDATSTPHFDLKAITQGSAESCYIHLLNSTRKQIEDAEFFINKAKSSLYKLKFAVENDIEISSVNLKTMERSICTQFIHISNTLLHLTNIDIPLGVCNDTLIRILILFFISLNNLTKHFIVRHSTIPISFQGVKYDQVVRLAGKPLATRVYALIVNIDEKISKSSQQKKKSNPNADRAKVLKETRFLPKLILRVENFNKFVMLLSKKTKSHLTHYLHIGTVRDFRIHTKNLKEAIDRSLSHSSQIENAESNDEVLDDLEDRQSDDNEDEETTAINRLLEESEDQNEDADAENVEIVPNIQLSTDSEISPIDIEETPLMGDLENESAENSGSQFFKNVAKVSEKLRKRKTTENEENSSGKITSQKAQESVASRTKRPRRNKNK